MAGQDGETAARRVRWATAAAFALGLAVRAALVAYGVWQDRTHRFRYTDVDYDVITDGAAAVAAGGSPYARATYRYSPVVAWLLVPGHWLGVPEYYGKALWALCDVAAAALLHRAATLAARTAPGPARTGAWGPLLAACLWLFNPLSINISTRGNYEAVVCVLVAGCLCALAARRVVPLALCLGAAVHLRVYPVIYALPLVLQMHHWAPGASAARPWYRPTRRQWGFGALCFGTFAALGALCYAAHGRAFVEHTYLYHLTRVDHRHNLSVYWYHLLLELWHEHAAPVPPARALRLAASLASFVPQVAALAAVAARFCITDTTTSSTSSKSKGTATSPASFGDTVFGLWAMTVLFVAFNKVYTVQYFAWWLVLLPLAGLATPRTPPRRLARAAALWAAALVLWLLVAYRLEFGGANTMLALWGCGLALFAASVAPVVELCYLRAHPLPSTPKSKSKQL